MECPIVVSVLGPRVRERRVVSVDTDLPDSALIPAINSKLGSVPPYSLVEVKGVQVGPTLEDDDLKTCLASMPPFRTYPIAASQTAA